MTLVFNQAYIRFFALLVVIRGVDSSPCPLLPFHRSYVLTIHVAFPLLTFTPTFHHTSHLSFRRYLS